MVLRLVPPLALVPVRVHGSCVDDIAGGAIHSVEALAHPRPVVAEAAVGAVHVAEVIQIAHKVAVGGGDARAVGLNDHGERIVP